MEIKYTLTLTEAERETLANFYEEISWIYEEVDFNILLNDIYHKEDYYHHGCQHIDLEYIIDNTKNM